jgi:pimeloyl-ACP methyl ester carboxylesterase
MLRVQNPRLGIDYLQNERDMKLYQTLLYELLVNKKKPLDIVSTNPEYDRILRRDMNYVGTNSFLTRDISFSQTLNDQNIAAIWAKTDCKVLSAWGETDIQVVNDFSHREVVNLINTYHPGNATFLELTDTDHNFLLIPTIEESYQRNVDGSLGSLFPTRFNEQMVEEFHQWIQSVIVN